MKRPREVPSGPLVVYGGRTNSEVEVPALRQPELEEALFEIGEELVGERRLEEMIEELDQLGDEEREAMREMGASDLLGDIIEGDS